MSYAGTTVSDRSAAWMAARDAKILDVRAQQAAAEMAEVKNIPSINATSSVLASDRSRTDVGTRLYLDAARIRAVKAELADAIAAAEYSGVPQITKTAASLQRDGDVGERLYAQAVDLERKKRALAESEAVVPPSTRSGDRGKHFGTGASSVSSLSSHSPDSARRRVYPTERQGAGFVQASWERAGRGGDSPSRLRGTSQHSRGSENKSQSASITSDLIQHMNIPGQQQPVRKSNPAMTDLLYSRAEVYRKRQEDRIAQAEKEARERANPDLNKKSMEIAAMLSPERVEQFYKRSISRTDDRSASERGGEGRRGEERPDPEATHQPKITPSSAALAAKRNPPGVAVSTRLYADASSFRARRQELQRLRQQEELKDCTFYPNQRSASVEPEMRGRSMQGRPGARSASGGRLAGDSKKVATPVKPNSQVVPPPQPPPKVSPKASADMYRKQVAWAREKDRRLEQERIRKAVEEVADCTFQPLQGVDAVISAKLDAVRSSRRASLPHGQISGEMSPSQAAKLSSAFVVRSGVAVPVPAPPVPSVEVYKGVDDFVNRYQKGRQIAYEKTHPRYADGSKWTGRTTKVQSFGFVKRTGEVKALQQPVEPATASKLGLTLSPQAEAAHKTMRFATSNRLDVEPDLAEPPAYQSAYQPVYQPAPAAVSQRSSHRIEVATADDIMARVRQLETLSHPQPSPSGFERFFGPAVTTVPHGLQRNPLTSTDAYFSGNGVLSPKASRVDLDSDPLLQRIERMASAATHAR